VYRYIRRNVGEGDQEKNGRGKKSLYVQIMVELRTQIFIAVADRERPLRIDIISFKPCFYKLNIFFM